MKHIILTLITFISLQLNGYSQQMKKEIWPKETVLTPGESLSVTNKSGTMVITYISVFKRRYSWADFSQTVTLDKRTYRWYGALGIYSAGGWPTFLWKKDGVSRVVAQEAQLNFNSVEDFLKWYNQEWNRDVIVYNDSGIAAGWGISKGREQLTVDVWKILIAGKVPKYLPGAKNSAIKLIKSNSIK